MSRILVFGGTGHVGRAVVRKLASEGDEVVFTWHTNATVAADLPGRGIRVDLAQPGAVDAVFARLEGQHLDALVYCAGVPATDADLDRAIHVHVGALLDGCRCLAAMPSGSVHDGGPRGAEPPLRIKNVVAFGALAPGQSFPVNPVFAAAQGALASAVMALGHSLGPKGIRVNVVALGVLDGGAADVVPPEQAAGYLRFSALRRVGTAAEAAATAVWLARSNTVMNGRVLAANGGI